MKRFFGSIVFFVVILTFSVFGNAQNSDKASTKFNPSGDYHPENHSTIESEKFIQFNLQVKRRKGKLIAWGEVRGIQPWYKFTNVSLSQKKLRFSTVKVNGVNYQFEGDFVGKGNFASQFAGNGIVMLKGTLRRFFNNKMISELTTSFVYYPGC